MAAVELVAGWEAGVTEPAYRLLDRATTAAERLCAGSNLTGSGGPNAEVCDREAANCSCWSDERQEIRSPPNWPVFLLFVIVIMTIGGNVLVCLAVGYKRKLQNMFNYFLVSLAMSDMMSAILVMPLSIMRMAVGTYTVIIIIIIMFVF